MAVEVTVDPEVAQKVDKNGDGQVTLDEFSECMLGMCTKPQNLALTELYRSRGVPGPMNRV